MYKWLAGLARCIEARLIPGEEPRRGPLWVSLEIFGTHFDGQEQHFNRIWSKESTVLGLVRLRVRPYISLFLQACSPWNSLQSVKNLSCWIERKAAKRPPTPIQNLVEIYHPGLRDTNPAGLISVLIYLFKCIVILIKCNWIHLISISIHLISQQVDLNKCINTLIKYNNTLIKCIVILNKCIHTLI